MNSYYDDYQDAYDEREYSEDEFQEAYRKENDIGYDDNEDMYSEK